MTGHQYFLILGWLILTCASVFPDPLVKVVYAFLALASFCAVIVGLTP